MTKKSSRRTLAQHLSSWPLERLAGLLQRRPDLARSPAPASVVELADRAQRTKSLVSAINELNQVQNRVVQILVCGRRDPTDDELAAILPEGMTLLDIEPVLTELEDRALVWRHGGRVMFPGALGQLMPLVAGLGPSLRDLVEHQTVDEMSLLIRNVRASVDKPRSKVAVPPSVLDGTGRPRRDEVVDELCSLLARPEVVEAVLADAPAGMAALVAQLADGSPHVDIPLYSSPPRRYERTMQPELWLVTRGLLLPYHYHAVQPREVGLALRGGRPFRTLSLVAPDAADGAAPAQSVVDAAAADRALHTVHLVADLCDWLAAEPLPCLKDGGLGARSLKLVSTRFDLTVEEAGRLVNLAHFTGLLGERRVDTGKGRTLATSYVADPSGAGRQWLERPPAHQWRHLARAWLRTSKLASIAGRRDIDGKVIPAMDRLRHGDAYHQRWLLLTALASLGDGEAASVASLTDRLTFFHPHALNEGVAPPSILVELVLEEAERLGVVAHGRLSTYGALLLDGDDETAAVRFGADLPAEADGFTLQADHTIVAVGTLARATALELRLLADVESKGAATTFRINERSLRRAFDAGRSAETILGFLQQHATKGIPQAITYLVNDVGRRYGNVRVGPAASFVRCEDAALLADIVSHKRTRKLKLTQLAPTVAVSSLTPPKLIEGLRDAGFLPARYEPPDGDVVDLEGGDAASVAGSRVAGSRVAGSKVAGSSVEALGPLPEPYAYRAPPQRESLTLADAEALARHLQEVGSGAGPTLDDDAGLDGDDRGDGGEAAGEPARKNWRAGRESVVKLQTLVRSAMHGERALLLQLSSDPDEPVRVLPIIWTKRAFKAVDLDSEQLVVAAWDDVIAIADLGPPELSAELALIVKAWHVREARHV